MIYRQLDEPLKWRMGEMPTGIWHTLVAEHADIVHGMFGAPPQPLARRGSVQSEHASSPSPVAMERLRGQLLAGGRVGNRIALYPFRSAAGLGEKEQISNECVDM